MKLCTAVTRTITMVVWLIPLGCTTVSQTPDTAAFYARSMELTVNGKACVGTCVVPYAKQYKMHIEGIGDLDYLSIESCHRKVVLEDQGSDTDWIYTPTDGLELGPSCPVEVVALEKKKARNSFALIDFESSEFTLPATMRCNGEVVKANGVSICQSKFGLIQSIEFPNPVVVHPSENCPLDPSKDNRYFEFHLNPKACVYVFLDKAMPARFHKLTTIGYQDRVLEKL
jgi:hypothetical protein